MDIIEGNKLIAKTIGYVEHSKYLWILPIEVQFKTGLPKHAFVGDNSTGLDFHNNWNSLMKIVEWIENLDLKEECYKWKDGGKINYNFSYISVEIEAKSCLIAVNLSLDPMVLVSYSSNRSMTKLQNTWLAVVGFITWYNGRSK